MSITKRATNKVAVGKALFLPQNKGFDWNPYRSASEFSNTFALGSISTRVTRDADRFTLIAGFGTTPTGSAPYIRALILHREMETGGSRGLAMVGNNLSPYVGHAADYRLSPKYEKHVQDELQMLSWMLQFIKDRLGDADCIQKDSCLVNLRLLRTFSQGGSLEDLLVETLKRFSSQRANGIAGSGLGESLDTDLDYEVGLGIDKIPMSCTGEPVPAYQFTNKVPGQFHHITAVNVLDLIESIELIRQTKVFESSLGLDPGEIPTHKLSGYQGHDPNIMVLAIVLSNTTIDLGYPPDWGSKPAGLWFRTAKEVWLEPYLNERKEIGFLRRQGTLLVGVLDAPDYAFIGNHSGPLWPEMSYYGKSPW